MKSVHDTMKCIQYPTYQFGGAESQRNAMILSIKRITNEPGNDKKTLDALGQLKKVVDSVYATPQKTRRPWIDKDSDTIKKMYPKLKEYKGEHGLKEIPMSGHHIIGKSMLTQFLSKAVQSERGKQVADDYLKAVGITEKHIRDRLIESDMLSKNTVNPEALSDMLSQVDLPAEQKQIESAVGKLLWPKWNIVMGPSNKYRSDDMCNGQVLDLFKSKGCDPQLVEVSKIAERIWDAMNKLKWPDDKGVLSALDKEALSTLEKEFRLIAGSPLAEKDVYWYPQEADWKKKECSVFNPATNRIESKELCYKNKEKGETRNPSGSSYIANNLPSRFRSYTNFEKKLRDDIVLAALEFSSPKQQKAFITECGQSLNEISRILDAREYQIMAGKKQASV
ncbi:hypothetical protein [Vibrio sp. CUB2]|uniref:hypothetical protein n=1 Tax=Vibrio sp. CUB2 TaxID=2315233 RepID=UPI00076A46C6|nr:hypothetical protein [Vibrio sp. CUB2]